MLVRLLLTTVISLSLASPLQACTVPRSPNLHDLLSSAAVVSAHLRQIEKVKRPIGNPDKYWARLTFITTQTYRGAAPRIFYVFFPDVSIPKNASTSAEDLSAIYPIGTYTLALHEFYKADKSASKSIPSARIQGDCGSQPFFRGQSSQARAIELIFDDVGDSKAEIELFNEFFNYGQGGLY